MVDIVEQAVKGSSLGIVRTRSSTDPNVYEVTFNQETYVGTERVQKHEGTAIITELEDGDVQVQIINPRYHFSVPDENRENYRRRLFDRIDDLL